jgi:hypothetical protein
MAGTALLIVPAKGEFMKTSGYIVWGVVAVLMGFTLFFNVHMAVSMRIAMAVLLLLQIAIVWKVVALFKNEKPESPFKKRLFQNKN